ncbi:MAG TPA: MazG-like family protein [Peptostreptococcaceae bacterium]|nr:MazG-like family protein [Peptostreptococcaceae bacterium]
MRLNRNLEVTRNIKIIEWMKTEILVSIGDLFNLLYKGVKPLDEVLQDTLANIIMVTYLLSKRLGVNFSDVDYKIKEKIKTAINEDHSIERWYGDLSSLKKHIDHRE